MPPSPWAPRPSRARSRRDSAPRSERTNWSPGPNWENAQFGARLGASLALFQGLDLGLTGFRGRKGTPAPSIDLAPTATPGSFNLTTTLNYERFYLLGLDAVLAMDGGLLVKAAIGHSTSGDTPILEPGARLASVQAVAGFEYGIGALKASGEYRHDWSKAALGESGSSANSLALTLGAEMEGRLGLRLVGMYKDDESGLVSPQVSCTVADGLTTELKAYVFLGAATTTYGRWQDNSMGAMSLKYQF